MPFNNEGLWTPDETVGQAPLAGLEINNVEQSLQNFHQAQAAKREQALLEMLKAGKDSGVDVGASPSSQGFENVMGMTPGESSGLFHQLPQQKFLDSYNNLSPEDQQDPDKVGAAAMASGASEPPWYLKQIDQARKQQLADTAQQKVDAYRLNAIQGEVTRSIKENQKQFDGPQQAAQAATDQIIATRTDLTQSQIEGLKTWVASMPTAWPENSQIGSGVSKTQAGTKKTAAETKTIDATRQGKVDLLASQKTVDDARAGYLNAASGKAAASTDIAKQKLAQDWADKAQKHVDALTKAGAPADQIATAQIEARKAQAALKPVAATAGAKPVGAAVGRAPGIADTGDWAAPDGKHYIVKDELAYAKP